MPADVKKEFLSNIRKRLTPQPIKVRADIEVTCFEYEGIDAVKAALTAGEAHSTDLAPIKVSFLCFFVRMPIRGRAFSLPLSIQIRLVAPPMYVMITQSLDKTLGITALEEAIVKIEEKIKALGGSLTIKMKPRAVSENDDLELQALMAKMEKQNAEISGDDYE